MRIRDGWLGLIINVLVLDVAPIDASQGRFPRLYGLSSSWNRGKTLHETKKEEGDKVCSILPVLGCFFVYFDGKGAPFGTLLERIAGAVFTRSGITVDVAWRFCASFS